MPVVEELNQAGSQKDQDIAWAAAEAERNGRGALVPTGAALANEDQELARNRSLSNPAPVTENIDPKKVFRAPRTESSAPAEEIEADDTAAKADRPMHSAGFDTLYTPPQERKQRPPAPAPLNRRDEVEVDETEVAPAKPPKKAPLTPDDEEGIRLERQLLGTGGSEIADDLPDFEVDIGGKKTPLSRIRSWKDSYDQREKWQGELTRKSQATADAWKQVMTDAARDLKNDPVGAMRKLGMSDQDIIERLERSGLNPGSFARSQQTPPVTAVPDDADPLTKSLAHKAQTLEQAVSRQSREIEELRAERELEQRRRSEQANEQSRMATLSGVRSELLTSASKMPSMRDDKTGKLSVNGKLLVDKTMLMLERDLGYGQVPDHESVRRTAFSKFGEQAREAGITPKAEQARAAIERKKTPIPARPGTTLSSVHPGAPGAGPIKPGAIDFSDDDARRRGMRAYFAQIEAELAGG